MYKTIRCFQRGKSNERRSSAETLRDFWEMEEKLTGKRNPMKRQIEELNIPELDIKPLDDKAMSYE